MPTTTAAKLNQVAYRDRLLDSHTLVVNVPLGDANGSLNGNIVTVWRTSAASAAKMPESQWCSLASWNGLEEVSLHPLFTVSLITAMLALVGVFIEIPFVSNYAFWVLFGAYVLLAGRK
jgi:hypothetical protein